MQVLPTDNWNSEFSMHSSYSELGTDHSNVITLSFRKLGIIFNFDCNHISVKKLFMGHKTQTFIQNQEIINI